MNRYRFFTYRPAKAQYGWWTWQARVIRFSQALRYLFGLIFYGMLWGMIALLLFTLYQQIGG